MKREYLGSALRFPLLLLDGSAATISDKGLIEQSILIILNSFQGEEFFLPEFGGRLNELQFEPNDEVSEDLARLFIFEALKTWEKRAEFTDVEFSYPSEDTVNCEVRYRILQSNEVESFVFPFYDELIH